MFEHTKIYVTEDNGNRISNAAFLDNSGTKGLISYDANKSSLSAIESFDINTYDYFESSSITLSSNTSSDVKTSRGSATFVKNNRELHIGFGGSTADSAPQWLGYVNHKVFGENNTDTLYQDEDTVHAYDDSGINTLSKVCLAGEYEYITCVRESSSIRIDHDGHKMKNGNNIVVREWMDAANSWVGAGVYYVTDASATDHFHCARNTDLDVHVGAHGASSADGFYVNNSTHSRGTDTGKICYRPYYYYGFKDGDDRIYRITPSTRINAGTGLDTVYTAGTMEASLPLPSKIKSICTYYNKADDGLEGGKIYALSEVSDEVYVLDLDIPFDEWKSTNISNHILYFKQHNHI